MCSDVGKASDIQTTEESLFKFVKPFGDLVEREEARRSFEAFGKYALSEFHFSRFHTILAQELDHFYQDFCAGRSPRLMLFAPPQHGKSTLVSRLFPAWVLGKNPNLRIIACSYSSSLAYGFSRDIQRLMQSPSYEAVFKKTPPEGEWLQKKKVKAREAFFETHTRDGGYWSCGVEGSLTGMRADLAFIDDPIKDLSQAHSQASRQALWEWYKGTFYTRLSPKGGIILCMTRWHKDDLAGLLLNAEPKLWRVLSFPALATCDDGWRKKGDALHEERFSKEELNKRRALLGGFVFESLYQQNPTPAESSLIQSSWFRRHEKVPPLDSLAIFCDTAYKTGRENDYSVLQLWGKGKDGFLYFLNQLRGKWEVGALFERVIDFLKVAKETRFPGDPHLRYIAIEDHGSGTTLLQQLKTQCHFPLKHLRRTKDKLTRFYDIQGYLSSGFVSIPKDVSFVNAFLDECESFNAFFTHAHDDQVDAMIDAIQMMLATSSPSIYDVL